MFSKDTSRLAPAILPLAVLNSLDKSLALVIYDFSLLLLLCCEFCRLDVFYLAFKYYAATGGV
jgi:hypothetical protein